MIARQAFPHRRSAALLTLVMCLALTAAPRSAVAQGPGNAAGFEIDANLRCNVGPGPFGEDWYANTIGPCVGVIDALTCAPNPARVPSIFRRDPHWAGNAVDPDHFSGMSNKNNDNIAADFEPWSYGPGSGPQKNDITEVYAHSRKDGNGHVWLMLGASTRSSNGDEHIDFEFNRAGFVKTGGPSGQIVGLGPANGRSAGDLIVSVDFLTGGTNPVSTVRQWDGTQFVLMPAPAGAIYTATNFTDIESPCGATAPDGSAATSYIPQQFVEAGVDLSAIGIPLANLCSSSATFMVKTRSSASFTAELKDLALYGFSIIPAPPCAISGPATICPGQAATLCGPAGDFGYAWSNGSTAQCITVSAGGSYSLTVTDRATGCSSQPCSHTLVVYDRPACGITGPASICQGESAQLCGPAGNFTYAWSNGATTPCITVSAAGDYSLTVTDRATGCNSLPCSHRLTVNPRPTCGITGPAAICQGQSAQLCGPVGNFGYAWSNGATTPCITVSTGGTYSLTVTDLATGCVSNTCAHTLAINPRPTCGVTGPASICEGASAQLCGPAGNFGYAWSNGVNTRCITVSAGGTYTLSITDLATGCASDPCAHTLAVNPRPACGITGPASICAGANAELCGPAGNFGYAWSNGAITRCITVSDGGDYSLTVTDLATGCSSLPCSHRLTVNPRPACTITGPDRVCTTQSAELCGPTGNFGYAWSTGAASRCITVTATGTYTLTVTNLATGCVSLPCSRSVVREVCGVNCPRTPGFWTQQCQQKNDGSTKFTAGEVAALAACVDDHSLHFDWPAGTDFSSFCSTIDSTGNMTQGKQAERQFATLLANVCTGENGFIASNGDVILLRLDTPVACDGFAARTLGALIEEVDDQLRMLAPQNLRKQSVKAAYDRIIGCVDAINNGRGIGTTCGSSLASSQVESPGETMASAAPRIDRVSLARPTPNPFSRSTLIGFALPSASTRGVELGIYDLSGRRVRALASGPLPAGRHQAEWNGRDDQGQAVRNGVYFVRLSVDGVRRVGQVIVMR